MGLGDDGLKGIRCFCEQHKCNSICHEFKLPKLSTIDLEDLGQTGRLSGAGDNVKNLEDGEIADTRLEPEACQSLEI